MPLALVCQHANELTEARIRISTCRRQAKHNRGWLAAYTTVPNNRDSTDLGFTAPSVILGFFKRALEISGAKKVDVHFAVPIEAGEKFCELALLWE